MTDNSSRKPSPLVRISGRYGLFGSLVAIIAILVLYYVNRHPLLIPLAFDLRILLFALFIVFSIKDFKNFNQKALHYWQGLAVGIITYVMIAMLASIFIWIFAGAFDPEFVNEYVRLSIDKLNSHKGAIIQSLGQDKYDFAIERLPHTTAGNLAFDYFLKSMPIGFILTLIISLFLRQQPK